MDLRLKGRVALITVSGRGIGQAAADVCNPEQIDTLAEQAIGAFGKVDILVNNAGFTRDKYLTKMPLEDWHDTGVAATAEQALRMAGVTRDDMDVVQIYDHFTIGVIQALEELGFCARGEGGEFVRGG